MPALVAGLCLAGTALAETRFMRLSAETVSGRKVVGASGGIWIFHRDGRFTGQSARREPFVATWKIQADSSILVTNAKTGISRNWSTFIDGGQQFVRITAREGRREFQDRIVSITSAE
jgi:hypothetical protein